MNNFIITETQYIPKYILIILEYSKIEEVIEILLIIIIT